MSIIKLNQKELAYLDSIIHDPKVRISFWQKILQQIDKIEIEDSIKQRDDRSLEKVRNKITSLFR